MRNEIFISVSPKIIDSKLCLMKKLVLTLKINIMNAHIFSVMANGKVESFHKLLHSNLFAHHSSCYAFFSAV